MKIYKIIRNSGTIATVFFSAMINATPVFEFDLDGMIAQVLEEKDIAEIDYELNSVLSVSPDLSKSAGSTAAFLAVSFNRPPENQDRDHGNSSNDSTFRSEGNIETFAEAGNDAASSSARITSVASAISEISALSEDNLIGLGVNASSTVEGVSEAWIVLTTEAVSGGNSTTSSGSSESDSFAISTDDGLSSFSTASSSSSTFSEAFLSGSYHSSGFSDGATSSLANGLGETFAISTDQLATLSENPDLEGGTTESNSFAFIRNKLLASGARTDFFANSLSELLVESIDALIESGSNVTSIGVSLSDTSATLTDEQGLIVVSNAGFLSISSSESFAKYNDSQNLFGANNGVKALAFGYTETFIQRIPEPGSLGLVLLGLMYVVISFKLLQRRPSRKDAH